MTSPAITHMVQVVSGLYALNQPVHLLYQMQALGDLHFALQPAAPSHLLDGIESSIEGLFSQKIQRPSQALLEEIFRMSATTPLAHPILAPLQGQEDLLPPVPIEFRRQIIVTISPLTHLPSPIDGEKPDTGLSFAGMPEPWKRFSNTTLKALTDYFIQWPGGLDTLKDDRLHGERLAERLNNWTNIVTTIMDFMKEGSSEPQDEEELRKHIPIIVDFLLLLADEAQRPNSIFFQVFWRKISPQIKMKWREIIGFIVDHASPRL